MVKHAALLSLGLGLITMGLVGIPWFREPLAYSRFALDNVELRRQAEYLDEQLHAGKVFRAIEEEILCTLAQGDLSLTQACDCLYQRARAVHPRFLCFLRDPKLTLKEKMARNLISFFRLEAEEKSSSYMEVVLRLERELAAESFCDWCRKPWPEDNQESAPPRCK